MKQTLSATDIALINRLQDGIPVVERPFAVLSGELAITEDEIAARIRHYLDQGLLTRFGPLFNVDRMGGSFCLCAMAVPSERFEEVAAIVNGFAEVAHNYERDHQFNMWFVLATETSAEIVETARSIKSATGIETILFPKEAEYFVGLRVPA